MNFPSMNVTIQISTNLLSRPENRRSPFKQPVVEVAL